MAWGGTYSGLGGSNLAQWGITVFEPSGGSPVPLPSTFLLMVSGLAGLAGLAGTLPDRNNCGLPSTSTKAGSRRPRLFFGGQVLTGLWPTRKS